MTDYTEDTTAHIEATIANKVPEIVPIVAVTSCMHPFESTATVHEKW